MPASAGTNLFRNIISLANLLAFGAIGLLFVLNASPFAFTLGSGALSLVLITQTISFWYESSGKPQGREWYEIVGGISLIILSLIALTLTVAAGLVAGGILNSASITLGTIAPSLTTILASGFAAILVAATLLTALPVIAAAWVNRGKKITPDVREKLINNSLAALFLGLISVAVGLAIFGPVGSVGANILWGVAAVILVAGLGFLKTRETISDYRAANPSESQPNLPSSTQQSTPSASLSDSAPSSILSASSSDLNIYSSLQVNRREAQKQLESEQKARGARIQKERETKQQQPKLEADAKAYLKDVYDRGTIFGDQLITELNLDSNPAFRAATNQLAILTKNVGTAEGILRELYEGKTAGFHQILGLAADHVPVWQRSINHSSSANSASSIRYDSLRSLYSSLGDSSRNLDSISSHNHSDSQPSAQTGSHPKLDE